MLPSSIFNPRPGLGLQHCTPSNNNNDPAISKVSLSEPAKTVEWWRRYNAPGKRPEPCGTGLAGEFDPVIDSNLG